MELDADTFEHLIGAPIAVEGTALELVPTEVARAGSQHFSVLFRGPAEPVLAQATYSFRLDDGDATPIFIVPLATNERETTYEAVFSDSQPD